MCLFLLIFSLKKKYRNQEERELQRFLPGSGKRMCVDIFPFGAHVSTSLTELSHDGPMANAAATWPPGSVATSQ